MRNWGGDAYNYRRWKELGFHRLVIILVLVFSWNNRGWVWRWNITCGEKGRRHEHSWWKLGDLTTLQWTSLRRRSCPILILIPFLFIWFTLGQLSLPHPLSLSLFLSLSLSLYRAVPCEPSERAQDRLDWIVK